MEVTDSAQGTYIELPTWYPYEVSQKSNPAEEAVPAKVFKVRNLSDIRRNEIIKGYYDNHCQECPLNVYMEIKPLFVYPHKRIWYNDTSYQNWHEGRYEIELLQIIRNTHKKSLAIEDGAVR